MNRLNLHHLYIYWQFGKTESVTKTAETLLIAQSAVTKQLQLLEDSLGMNLIDRTKPRDPKVTFEGKKVLEYAEKIFETSSELFDWATKGVISQKRIIRIGALSGLSRTLQYEFMKPLLHDHHCHFDVFTGDQKLLVEKLKNHEIDVILSSKNVLSEKSKDYYSHVLTKSSYVFVTQKRKGLQDLALSLKDFSLYIPGPHFEGKAELEAFFKKNKLKPRIVAEIEDIALLRIMALKTGDVVLIPEMGVLHDLKEDKLVILKKIPHLEQKFFAITKSKVMDHHDVEFLINSLQTI